MTDEIYEEVMWSPWTDVGLEYLCMAGGQGGVTATGLVMRMPGLPWGFRYVVNLERRWLMRRIAFEPLDRPGWPLHLEEEAHGVLPTRTSFACSVDVLTSIYRSRR